jgi:hypothetical protein
VVNCQQLAEMGYLPSGVQSFVPGGNLNGGFQVPNGCSSGNLGVEYDGIKMVFNSPQIPILAVIAKDLPLSRVYYFGSGVTQVRFDCRSAATACCELPWLCSASKPCVTLGTCTLCRGRRFCLRAEPMHCAASSARTRFSSTTPAHAHTIVHVHLS